ncbi:hypothetical protein O0I10_011442 [Lichtheimia ornata]|uniref:Heterokaryon incompatibility domain-containing protein n=1 Tax=Lichtheimia ornata TaxID=688661 RepID=A0AAD7USW3_9FUNG|nr:uncharacterized protein O0I10_011442 [Lichtheimia ornata]KAJ8652908.1 hypothetical protein O0I10_011442 [Lichtheimia ornata]
MTCDTEEDNDPYKINIKLDDDDNDDEISLKAYFEKGLSALLADDHFLLLYVPENGGRMQVIRPASDLYHRRRMIKKINEGKWVPSFYYALSHLWGLTKDNQHHWNEIGDYVDDENGKPMDPISMRPEKRDALLALLKDHADSYWWIDVLCARTDTPLDIMGDIYACCLECIAMIDCEPSLISRIYTISPLARKEAEKLKRRGGGSLTYQEQLHQTKGSLFIHLLYTFFQSQWWQRVWTWQEMALPFGGVRFMAEIDVHRLQTYTITMDDVYGFLYMTSIFWFNLNQMNIHAVYTYLQDVVQAKLSNVSRIGRKNANFVGDIMDSLKESNRRCYDPCDYVYGVLGMMQIKIPRMEDPNAVWRHFLSELDDLYPLSRGRRWIDHADEIDLRQVESISEVYAKLRGIDAGY